MPLTSRRVAAEWLPSGRRANGLNSKELLLYFRLWPVVPFVVPLARS